MVTEVADSPHQAVGVSVSNEQDDPFASTPPRTKPPHPHRYSSFDTHLFAQNRQTSSPAQAKRSLEAHLAETERRLQEASKLGTTLVQQRRNLSERLREVEKHQADEEIGPELRQKLAEIEKEYTEVSRESVRAFLGPKTTDSGEASNAPFALDGRLNVPRKQRNQPSNRAHDLDFAAEITTSLIDQVKQLQAALVEKEDSLKSVNIDKARLEHEAAGFSLRLKSLDESEQRYKDENWSLETQTHELIGAAKEGAAREQKLQQSLASISSEKSAAQRDLDDLRQNHGKLIEDHDVARRMHESELSGLRKNVALGESEKTALQRKVEELTSQNQELARAVAGRFRDGDADQSQEGAHEPDEYPMDRSDAEHSPPPSPSKGVPRHSLLESETLRSSLRHAHKMIQNLKSNVQREKAEKIDLKRMLQEARDELDVRMGETRTGHDNKRLKPNKSQQDLTKRQARPNMLGASRNSKTDITATDDDWEDREGSPRRAPGIKFNSANGPRGLVDASDAYQTANETEDGFETANERNANTDTDNFQTGAESITGDSSDDLTETEGGVVREATIRGRKPSPLTTAKAGDRNSFQSTASTSADEEPSIKTLSQGQPQRYRLKINRGSRRSRVGSEAPDNSNPSTAKNSPASFVGNGGQGGQSLFNELGDLDGGDSGEDVDTPSKGIRSHRSTPSMKESTKPQRSGSSLRGSISSRRSSSAGKTANVPYGRGANHEPPVPPFPLVDSSTMTEPWEPTQASQYPANPAFAPKAESTVPSTPQNRTTGEPSLHTENPDSVSRSTSVSPRTVWDQPLQMFSGIIPTFGPASHRSTPLSTRSAASQEIRHSEFSDQNAESVDSPTANANDRLKPVTASPTLEKATEASAQPQEPVTSKLTFSPIHSVVETTPTEPMISAPPTREPPHVPAATDALSADSESSSLNRSIDDDEPVILDSAFTIPEPSAVTSDILVQPPQRSASALGNSWAHPNGLGGILGSVFSGSKTERPGSPLIAEDETSRDFGRLPAGITGDSKQPFRELSPNAVQRNPRNGQVVQEQPQPSHIDVADEASQTILSSDQIDSMLKQNEKSVKPDVRVPLSTPLKPLSELGAASLPIPSSSRFETGDLAKGRVREPTGKVREPTNMPVEPTSKDIPTLTKAPRRPISTASIKSKTGQYPPLPPDHQQAIAAAAQKAPELPSSVMGPPGAPASSYRNRVRTPSRTRAPSDQRTMHSPSSRGGTTPKARHSTTRSQVSRRSSVSSFASEIDERFNIRLDGVPGVESDTDPRMIQAITQTMIGEFLWKYTRKAGRGEMSNNRHRRFFWVHPYTRTLYWSDHDPATAGRAQLKAKSVAIEAVRVVADDNPMPPGLHRKSLVIMTPGRSVKLTATTGQRHETWFNALSYLLLRTGVNAAGMESDVGNLTAEDIAEFNPSYNKRESSRSRLSLASWRSRHSSDPPQASLSSRHGASMQLPSRPPSQTKAYDASQNDRHSVQPPQTQQKSRGGSFSSRISEYWKPSSNRASISSRHSRTSVQQAGIGSANDVAVQDSAEDLRRVIEHADRHQGGMENVRACCDGRSSASSNILSANNHADATLS
ncbi:MAG: hypothetical protein Q9195_002030 [Heterodermia aff. obscurata]